MGAIELGHEGKKGVVGARCKGFVKNRECYLLLSLKCYEGVERVGFFKLAGVTLEQVSEKVGNKFW